MFVTCLPYGKATGRQRQILFWLFFALLISTTVQEFRLCLMQEFIDTIVIMNKNKRPPLRTWKACKILYIKKSEIKKWALYTSLKVLEKPERRLVRLTVIDFGIIIIFFSFIFRNMSTKKEVLVWHDVPLSLFLEHIKNKKTLFLLIYLCNI